MKKVFCIGGLILIAKFTSAQFKPGVTAGVNIANQRPVYEGVFNGQNANIYGKSVVSFNAGFFSAVPLNKNLKIKPHILYSGQGFEGPQLHDQNGLVIVYARKVTLSYINTPVQLVYEAPLSFGKLFIGTGPYAGILLGGKLKSNNVSRKINIGNTRRDDFKGFDFGLYNSIGLHLKNSFLIGASYQLGLMGVTPEGGKNKNHVISIFVGYN